MVYLIAGKSRTRRFHGVWLRLVPTVLVILWAAGCSETGQESALIDAAQRESQNLMLSDQPLFSIGGHDEREGYFFSNIGGAARLSDGRIVVADMGTAKLHYFDARGQLLGVVGGAGGGPGRFERLGSISRIQGDTIFAWDAVSRRYTLFPPDDDEPITRSVPIVTATLERIQRDYPRVYVDSREAYPASNGLLVLRPRGGPRDPLSPEIFVIRDTFPVVAIPLRADSGTIELGAFPADDWFHYKGSMMLLPFSERLQMAVAGDVVAILPVGSDTIRLMSVLTGATLYTIAVPARRAPLTENDRVQSRRRVLDGAPSNGRRRAEEMFDAMLWPEFLPLVSDLRIDGDGRIWVQLYRQSMAPTQEWAILEESGRPLANLRLGPGVQLLDMGLDFALVAVEDELGVQEVRMHSLARM